MTNNLEKFSENLLQFIKTAAHEHAVMEGEHNVPLRNEATADRERAQGQMESFLQAVIREEIRAALANLDLGGLPQ